MLSPSEHRCTDPHGFVRYRLGLILVIQTSLIALALFLSFELRLDQVLSPDTRSVFYKTLSVVIPVKLLVFYYFGLLRGWWRYVGLSDLLDIGKAALWSSGILFVIIPLSPGLAKAPRSVLIIDFALTVIIVGGARFGVRVYTETISRYAADKPTLVVGAGAAGTALVWELRRNAGMGFRPVGFIDDERWDSNAKIDGLEVLGPVDDLSRLVAEYDIKCVLIALDNPDGKLIDRVVGRCRCSNVDFKILPSLSQRLSGNAINHVRNVRVEDLLERAPVNLDMNKINDSVQGKSLLVTGAGGSIGSELARQLSSLRPKRLVLLERAEDHLFDICMQLSRLYPDVRYVPAIGDILDVELLRHVFATYRPDSVFHAAAYKHVPMMEGNCFQAITNNVFGTYNVALVARQCDVENLVFISSDKAVKPTNIMGASKRLAELIILSLQQEGTRYIAVRFGNVLGSSGSVLPIFEQQIAAGGPVTVTHPEAMRYFMTIPEAVQLVLQASTMGAGGEIYVLNMGEPVKIVDLAKKLIRLSGFKDGEIEILFTGLRPGEKLKEELMLDAEGLKPTVHDQLRVLDAGSTSFDEVVCWVDRLSAMVAARNVWGLVQEIMSVVPEYTPSQDILALCAVDRHDVALKYKRARAGLVSTRNAA